jgi:hypothetical protein
MHRSPLFPQIRLKDKLRFVTVSAAFFALSRVAAVAEPRHQNDPDFVRYAMQLAKGPPEGGPKGDHGTSGPLGTGL